MHTSIRVAALGAALASVILMTGCATLGSFETARTAEPGQFQFGGAVTPVHFIGSEEASGALFFPFPALYTRVGVAPGFDLGAVWSFGPGVGLNAKYQFLKGPLDAALYIGGSYYGMSIGGAGFGMYSVSPRFFLSSESRGSFPFMVNAGVNYGGASASGGGSTVSGGTLSVVAGGGLPFRIGGSRSGRIMPELQVSVPVMSTFTSGEESNTTAMLEGFVASIGVCFGSVGADRE